VGQWEGDGVIEYLGALDDVRSAFADAQVYVLPSYREGTPRTVLEAMAMGRPIITTDAPGCRETVVHGRNGFLVPVQDVEALRAAMERFILEPELAPAMGAESLNIARDKYDVHMVNAAILEAMGL
jgi:glycosyltransferase involved in cell wall biosynthesis